MLILVKTLVRLETNRQDEHSFDIIREIPRHLMTIVYSSVPVP